MTPPINATMPEKDDALSQRRNESPPPPSSPSLQYLLRQGRQRRVSQAAAGRQLIRSLMEGTPLMSFQLSSLVMEDHASLLMGESPMIPRSNERLPSLESLGDSSIGTSLSSSSSIAINDPSLALEESVLSSTLSLMS